MITRKRQNYIFVDEDYNVIDEQKLTYLDANKNAELLADKLRREIFVYVQMFSVPPGLDIDKPAAGGTI